MKVRYYIVIPFLIIIAATAVYMQYYNRLLRVRFNIHAFSRYLTAYEITGGKSLQSLSDVPDFDLVSYRDSLELKGKDLRSRVIDGYYYDFKPTKKGGFVMSASPLKVYPFSKEFGMTDDLNLRVNSTNVDPEADRYEEVSHWQILPEWFEIHTFSESS